MFNSGNHSHDRTLSPEEAREAEYFCNMLHAKRDILQTVTDEKSEIKILINVFSLCIYNVDHNNLEEKHKELYDCLFTLYLANQKKPLIDSLEENLSSIISLVKIFRETNEDIRKIDFSLYYAILGFINALKTPTGNRIYYRIP